MADLPDSPPALPLPDWRLGAEVRPIFGMTLLQGCLSLSTLCILIFFWVSLSHLRALDRDAEASRALVEAGDWLKNIQAIREGSIDEAGFIAALDKLDASPKIVSIQVWRDADGALIYRRGELPHGNVLAMPRGDAPRVGSHTDLEQRRAIQWGPLGSKPGVAAVEVDTSAFSTSGRESQWLKDEALIGVPPLLFLALFFVIWRLNVRELHRLTEHPEACRTDQGACCSRQLPWWASTELILARHATRQMVAMTQARSSGKKRMIALMQGVLDEAAEAVIACDANGRILVSNSAANQLWSPGGDTLVGEPVPATLMAFVGSDLATGKSSGWLAGLHPLSRRVLDAEVSSVHGGHIPMRLSSHVVFVEDAPWLVIQGLDRTTEISAQSAVQESMGKVKHANEAKSRFLATVSHEIRTPLNGLFGMLDLLSRSPLDHEQNELLETARTAGRQLRTLLDDVLDLSKIEAGKLEFESVAFDVREQLGRTVQVFISAAQLKGVTLSVHWHTPQRMLMGDAFRISQVLNNLLDNALKFTEAGFISVDIRTEQANADEALCNLWVTVEDSGQGIPPERMPYIFDPFAQAHESVSRTFGGSGLGLSLCRELCHGLGGHIAAAARPGGGTIFTFLVRCEVAYGMSPFVETQPPEDVQLTRLQGARVLAVDDNRVNQKLLLGWLKSVGASVTQAFDGEAAVTAVTAEPFDIILMDISMPVMNGLDATRAIRALAASKGLDSPRFASVPILGVSAHAMSGDREACLAAGMNGYVTKPIKRDVLFERMVRALSDTPPPDASHDHRDPPRMTLTPSQPPVA